MNINSINSNTTNNRENFNIQITEKPKEPAIPVPNYNSSTDSTTTEPPQKKQKLESNNELYIRKYEHPIFKRYSIEQLVKQFNKQKPYLTNLLASNFIDQTDKSNWLNIVIDLFGEQAKNVEFLDISNLPIVDGLYKKIVANFPSIKELHIVAQGKPPKISAKDLQELSQLKHLEVLNLQECTFVNDTILDSHTKSSQTYFESNTIYFPNLKTLNLSNTTEFTAKQKDHIIINLLPKLDHLNSLDLSGRKNYFLDEDNKEALDIGQSNKEIQSLLKLKHLSHLNLSEKDINMETLKSLQNLNLKTLTLQNAIFNKECSKATQMTIGSKNLCELNIDLKKSSSFILNYDLSNLTQLSLNAFPIDILTAKKLTPLKKLNTLKFESMVFSNDVLQNLKPVFESLTSLQFEHCSFNLENSDWVRACKNLIYLNMKHYLYNHSIPLRPEAIAEFCKITTLNKLTLEATTLNSDAIKNLKTLHSLTDLSLNRCKLTIEQLTGVFSCLTNLENLNLISNSISNDNIALEISKLRKLKTLDPTSNQLGPNAAIVIAKSLKNLISLVLTDNPIGDIGAKALSNLKTLKDLSLKDCKITDDGLSEFKHFTELERLALTGNPLTENVAIPLLQMNSLQNLQLSIVKPTDETVQKINQVANERNIYLRLMFNDE